MNSTNAQPQTLPALHASFQNLTTQQHTKEHNNNSLNNLHTNSNNYFYPKNYVKAIPIASNNNNGNNHGYLINSKRNQNANNVNSSNNLANTFAPFSTGVATTKGNVNTETWSKPRLITVIRATERPRRRISILLNRKALHSYEQFVCDISEAFGLPQWKNDKVRKLYTIRGKRVQGISDFFREDDIFIGVSGKEPLTGAMIQDLLAEVYPNEQATVDAIYKEWQATRAKPKPRYSSLEAAVGTNRDSGYGEGESSPEAIKKNLINSNNNVAVELDENGRKKSKFYIAVFFFFLFICIYFNLIKK